MRQAIVDRFEGKYAVLLLEGEDTPLNVLRKQLPRGTVEGDYLQIELVDGQIVKVERDPEATEQARERIQAKLERLRRGDHLRNGE